MTSGPLKILVGVDFGTTYSALAYVKSTDPEERNVIQEWGRGLTGEKVPTLLKYADGGIGGSFRWGFQADDDEPRHEWFKLCLYPELLMQSELAREYPSATALPARYGAECEKLVVDYLTSLRECADEYLRSRIDGEVLRTTPREYIITVPAVWSDKAQYDTRVCAERAGMGGRGDIQIISEPEAAGIYALNTMRNLGLHENDTFVLCDAGGGTVDLVSYTVEALLPTPLVFESAPGSGALCGSTFLNRIFEKYLYNRFKDHSQWNEDYQRDVLRRFEEEVKPRFTGDDNEVYRIPIHGLTDNSFFGIRNKKLEFKGKDLRKIVFEPVIKEIQKLVKAQIDDTPRKVKAVLLAGGFGRSEYLRKRLQEVVGGDIEVRKVENSNTSIVRGALIRGLAKVDRTIPILRLDSRIARRYYGIQSWIKFDPSKHDLSRKYQNPDTCRMAILAKQFDRRSDPFTDDARVEAMHWFINKGFTVKESDPSSFGFSVRQRVAEGPLKPFEIIVYVCGDHENKGAPKYREAGVVEHVKLKADLRSVPTSTLSTVMGRDSEEWYCADFDIEVTLQSAKLSFTLVHGNHRYEAVEAKFL